MHGASYIELPGDRAASGVGVDICVLSCRVASRAGLRTAPWCALRICCYVVARAAHCVTRGEHIGRKHYVVELEHVVVAAGQDLRPAQRRAKTATKAAFLEREHRARATR
jgi:hypothetical protein